MNTALVRVAWTPGRVEPDHRAEMVTQWLCGESLSVEETGPGDEWVRVRGPDGYRCWVSAGGLLPAGTDRVRRWVEAADRLSLGVRLEGRDPADAPGWLPWGARVAVEGDVVRLPGGASGRPEPADRLVPFGALGSRFPARPAAVAATAADWLGAPYLWGGRTPSGVDCSGLVQAVYRVHRVELPRDSVDQLAATADTRVEAATGTGTAGTDPGLGALAPGDLLFFGASEAEVTHVAVAIGGGRIVHAAAPRGAVAEEALDADAPFCRSLRERWIATSRPLATRD